MEYNECIEHERFQIFYPWTKKVANAASDGSMATWLSEFRGGMRCKVLGDIKFGACNWSLSVRWADKQKCVVRFPFEGKTLYRDEKTAREVAMMKYLRDYTSLPVPRVQAWGYAHQNPLGLGPYIIMDYIRGIPLSTLWQAPGKNDWIKPNIPEHQLRAIYRQVSVYLLELAEHPFRRIGALVQASQEDEVEVGPLLTRKIHEIEARTGVKMDGFQRNVFSSTSEFFRDALAQNWERLSSQANSAIDDEDARSQYVTYKEIEAAISNFIPDQDPAGFRLFCDGLEPRNILVKSATDLTIVGVIDWEWSYTVPYQMFASPPRWLALLRPAHFSKDDEVAVYSRLLGLFLDELQKQEDGRENDPDPGLILSGSEQAAIADASANQNRRVASPPDPRGRKLSDLMRENWDTGRFWFHEIVHSMALNESDMPWKKLTVMYPYLKGIYKVDQAEVDAFVKRKHKDFADYEVEWARVKKERDEIRAKDKEEMAKYREAMEKAEKEERAAKAANAIKAARIALGVTGTAQATEPDSAQQHAP